MNVIPPWKLSEREEWAEARPWLAGLYFDLLMSLFLAVYPMIIGGTEQLYLAALPQNPDQHSPERPVLLEVDQEHPSTPFGPRYGTRA